MNIVKLDRSHREAVKNLFYSTRKYMGVDDAADYYKNVDEKLEPEYRQQVEEIDFNEKLYGAFCSTYLKDLKTFHAFGNINEEGQVTAFATFYESQEEPSWYCTLYRSDGDNNTLKALLDKCIEYNETNGRLKFFTLVNKKHARLLRKFTYSDYNNDRYGYFDEMIIPKQTKCFFAKYWEVLFKRTLLPADTVIRCSFLKQEYRTTLPIGGNI
jgi:hypothetical protein